MLYLVKTKSILLVSAVLLSSQLILADSNEVSADPNAQKLISSLASIVPAALADANSLSAISTADANSSESNDVSVSQMLTADVNAAEPAPQAQEETSDGAAIQSLTFRRDMNIRDALKFLAAKYHKNIVPSLKVDGPLTVTSLYDVTFDEALKAILGKDFDYEQQGNFIKVYTTEEFKKVRADINRMQHKVFTLYYITALEAAKLITPVKSDLGMISTTTPAERQISGGTSSDSSGSSSSGSSSMSTAGGGDSTAIHDTVVMRDFPENLAKAAEIIASVDIRPKQVLIEATILSALLTDRMELGVDLNFLSGKGFVANVGAATGGTPIETVGFTGTQTGNGLAIGVTTGDVVGLITALETITDTTILANPKILAVNKQEGSMLIGKNIGYRSSTSISQGGVATEGEVKFLKSGTQLVFRPYIGNDGYIRMEIYPKDSTADLVAGVPQEKTTEIKSNILVKDGETIVIGGLFRDVVTASREQVPVLGDIPLLGYLFRGTDDSTERQEVIILITPHIIDQAGQTDGEKRLADVGRRIQGANKEMPFFSRTRIADWRYSRAVELYGKGDLAGSLSEVNAALDIQPAFLEAMRLKERIVCQTSSADGKGIERIMLEQIDRQEAPMWMRK